jgi:cell division septum initiation protein DivIVA
MNTPVTPVSSRNSRNSRPAGGQNRGVHDYGSIDGLAEQLPTERDFTVAFRGYDRGEVDRYIEFLEGQHAALTSAHDAAREEINDLTRQLHRVHMRILERTTDPAPGEATFGHLGHRAAQMLSLAEEAARELREQTATQIEAEHRRARSEVERIIGDADRRRREAIAACQAHLDTRRRDQERELAELTARAEAAAAQARSAAATTKADADHYVAARMDEAARIRKQAEDDAARIRARADHDRQQQTEVAVPGTRSRRAPAGSGRGPQSPPTKGNAR